MRQRVLACHSGRLAKRAETVRLCRRWGVVVGGSLLWIVHGVPAQAVELNPFNPPVQKAAPEQDAVSSALSAERERYYRDFRSEMLSLSPEKRAQLKLDFEKRRKAAKSLDEASHYRRLISILSSL